LNSSNRTPHITNCKLKVFIQKAGEYNNPTRGTLQSYYNAQSDPENGLPECF